MEYKYKCGIEREAFRVDLNGKISTKNHPFILGNKFTHPSITCDYAEAQLELITPPFKSCTSSLKFIEKLQGFICHSNPNELLWPLSMPPALSKDRVKLARFGSTKEAKLKTLYRMGIKERYGEKMQLISGIHFNFSFDEKVTTEDYLALIRNYLRYGYIITYLFGASPLSDNTYLSKKYPFATSLRMSHHGYYSRIVEQCAISFNHFDEYIHDLERALETPHLKYQDIEANKQINSHIFQNENEHYTRIRPKVSSSKKSGLSALKERGIEYVEIRTLDINPFTPAGISKEESDFLVQFLFFLKNKESPHLTKKEQQALFTNQNRVALFGRDPNLTIMIQGKEVPFIEHVTGFLKEMKAPVEIMEKIISQKIVDEMKVHREDHQSFGLRMAKLHQEKSLKNPLENRYQVRFEKEAEFSHLKASYLKKLSDFYTKGYETLEISTQLVIKEAQKRGLKVEVLDSVNNFIRLSNLEKSVILKQATQSEFDSLITYFIMENKLVTKNLLAEKGFPVPKTLSTSDYQHQKVIVKPIHTNFGIGISIAENKKELKKAIEKAKKYEDSFLIEAFLEGGEYRFLVIGNHCTAVLKRDPANIIGDGYHTIKELVEIKNLTPENFKHPKVQIRLGETENESLKAFDLKTTSILEKNRKIYLRKNSNVSTGGDPIDVTDEIHPEYKALSVKASQAIGAQICGVDMIIKNPKKFTKEIGIIEMNFNPTLAIHKFPFKGVQRHVECDLLDFFGFERKK
ncbi:MAG: bifunctional glutamate--cysteine ligase GshA/glutathione synthetase GshB [Simkaniaceae bacterium]